MQARLVSPVVPLTARQRALQARQRDRAEASTLAASVSASKAVQRAPSFLTSWHKRAIGSHR